MDKKDALRVGPFVPMRISRVSVSTSLSDRLPPDAARLTDETMRSPSIRVMPSIWLVSGLNYVEVIPVSCVILTNRLSRRRTQAKSGGRPG